ncbi:MAG: MotA/TolQ/ExbB proton channel family protein [Planctomycetes bacterium]|nr:MotA/TolQ/ExbB proton channel family protein [Planctomycetota bacterium]
MLSAVVGAMSLFAEEGADAAEESHSGGMAEQVVMAILAVCFILVIGVIAQKFLFWLKMKGQIKNFNADVDDAIAAGDVNELQNMCAESNSPLATVLEKILNIQVTLRPDQALLLMRNKLHEEGSDLKKFLSILATMAGTAPFIGLFGTVLGILETFSTIGESGFSNAAAIASGISQALVATAAGLGVAIPAVMCYNFFARKANEAIADAERRATDVLIIFGRM